MAADQAPSQTTTAILGPDQWVLAVFGIDPGAPISGGGTATGPLPAAPGQVGDAGTIPSRAWPEVADEALHGPAEYVPKLNIDPKVLASEDAEFDGPEGQKFKERIEDAAKKVQLDPGLLAAALLAEESRNTFTKSSGEENTFHIGADDFLEKMSAIKKEIPAAEGLEVIPIVVNVNEQRRKVTTGKFKAEDAVLVDAVYLKFGELQVRKAFTALGSDFDTLTPELKFAFTRLAMNPGKDSVKTQVEKFLKTRDIADTAPGVLIRTGVKDQDARKPQSGATRVAGIGVHLSQKIFGTRYMASGQTLEPPKPAKPPL